MKDHRLWMFGFMIIIFTSILSGDAQVPERIIPAEAIEEKPIEFATDHHSRKAPPIPAVAEKQKQLKRAEMTIAKYYDEVGKRLTATLADDEVPIRDRVQAAKRLGIMKYPPAIKTLIQNIQLDDPDIQVISGNETEPLVAVNALAQYGDAAVPQIIDAYLEGEVRLPYGIGNRQTALIYAKGLAADIKDKGRAKRLEWLIKRLSR